MILINPHRFSMATPYTWNPLDKAANLVLSDSDRNVQPDASGVHGSIRATYSASTGKRYFEALSIKAWYGSLLIGVGKTTTPLASYLGSDADSWAWSITGDAKFNAGIQSNSYSSPQNYSPNLNEYVGVLADLDNGRISFIARAGASLTVLLKIAYTNLSGTLFPMASLRYTPDNNLTANFTRDTWVLRPPADFVAWNEPAHSGTAGYAKFNSADKEAVIDIIGDYAITRNSNASPTWACARMTGGASTGKKYLEFFYTGDIGSSGNMMVGIGTAAATLANYIGNDALAFGYQPTQGRLWNNNSTMATYPSYVTPTQIVGLAVDLDSKTVDVYVNGVLMAPSSGSNSISALTGTVYVMGAAVYSGGVCLRIKPTDWTYSPPTGFSAWTA